MNTLEKSNDNIKNQSLEPLIVYLNKMKGESRNNTKFDYIDSIISVVGVFLAVSIICILAFSSNYSMVIGPLGASSILVFAAHNGPLSQPRQVIGGYILSTVTGLLIWSIFGKSLFIIILSLVIVLILMALTKTIHPPAAASALVAINFETGWGYLIPVFIGIFLLVFVSMLYNNLFPKRQYPKHWL
ncbi:HPP family protein [Bacillus sp. Y1]|jgi:CBS-domain-containing membrane protein|uniref:HPP family protein n=1 Tax=Robertmurraya sp. TaxID=2837525 RepID=UPI000E6B1D34|nr:HPP family protein [Bacillus sp. Y1]AYA76454.1 HPP family protein [Bacillus sp. Y1]